MYLLLSNSFIIILQILNNIDNNIVGILKQIYPQADNNMKLQSLIEKYTVKEFGIEIAGSGLSVGRDKEEKRNTWINYIEILEDTILKYIDNSKYYIIFDEFSKYIEGYSGHADQEWLLNFVYSFITKPKHIFLVHGEPEGQEILKSKIVDEIGLPVTIPEYGQTYTLDENLTMEQTVAPITPQMSIRRDVIDKIRVLKNELNDMETIVKEDYLAKKDNEEEISLLKLRLKEKTR